MTETLLRTPLYDTHVERSARLVEFAGWQMPVQFAGIIEEHIHTRTACSMFDVSHMGRLKLTGTDCESFLNRLCTRNLVGADVGRSYYSHMCREDGRVLDDLIVSRFESHWGIVCNGANREKIVSWLNKHNGGTDVRIKDETLATAMIAIQGPKTLAIAQEIVDTDLSSIKRYWFKTFTMIGMRITVYRSGYTGEDGFEVVVPAGIVKMLLPKLLGTKEKPHPIVKPAGLGAGHAANRGGHAALRARIERGGRFAHRRPGLVCGFVERLSWCRADAKAEGRGAAAPARGARAGWAAYCPSALQGVRWGTGGRRGDQRDAQPHACQKHRDGFRRK